MQDYLQFEEGHWDEIAQLIIFKVRHIVEHNFDPNLSAFEDPLTRTSMTVLDMEKQIELLLKDGPPFTMQRIAELLIDPNAQYGRPFVYKYLRALISALSVSSRINDYYPLDMEEEIALSKSQNPIDSEKPTVVLTDISWVVDTGRPENTSPQT